MGYVLGYRVRKGTIFNIDSAVMAVKITAEAIDK